MNCEDMEELAAAYAIGNLSSDQRDAVTEHLSTCPDHRDTLAGLTATAQLLPLTVTETPAPVTLRAALQAAVNKSMGGTARRPASRVASRFRGFPRSLSPATVLIFAGVIALLAWNVNLQWLGSSEPGSFAISLGNAEGATGRLVYLGSQELGVLTVEGLPPPGPEQTYQVWAVTKRGVVNRGPLKVGVDGRGFATITGDVSPDQGVFVTVESVSGSERPSGETVLESDR